MSVKEGKTSGGLRKTARADAARCMDACHEEDRDGLKDPGSVTSWGA
jgi:hypothetical protein